MLRQIKLVYWVNNLLNYSKLVCNKVLYKKFKINKSPFSSISSKDFKNTENENIPWLDKNATTNKDILAKKDFQNFNKIEQENILNWQKNGYMKLNNFYSLDEVAIINNEVDKLIKEKKVKSRYAVNASNTIFKSKTVLDLATKKSLTNLLSFVLGEKVKIFQSLNFLHGSEQKIHSDSIHMTTYPKGYLIAVWIALEDIDEGSGPLTYYEGSHQLPYVMNKDYDNKNNTFLLDKYSYTKYVNTIEKIIENNTFPQKTFLPKAGDILVWHANLLHGGTPIINDKLTRKSMVLHFYTENVICYHEITERPAIYNDKEAHCPSF